MKRLLAIFAILLYTILLAPQTIFSLPAPANPVWPEYVVHKVKRGHTLSMISRLYGVAVEEIKKENGLTKTVILVGQGLKIKPKYRPALVSWYGEAFAGKPMASGEIFYPKNYLVAHKTLPLGTWVELKNPHNEQRIVLQVKDRGPYVGRREFDLSEAAAEFLETKEAGVTKILVKIVALPS